MRTLRIMEHISLDGVIQHTPDENGFPHGDWTGPYRSGAGRDAVLAAQGERFDLLLGRRTYDLWSGYWPKGPASPMADHFNAATKFVATHRPDALPWGPGVGLGPDVVGDVRRLKAQDGPDLVLWGSSTVASPLLEHGLVDELVLIVYPVLLGTGKRLFTAPATIRAFALTDSQAFPSGLFLNRYRATG